jgi:hypothetical protein
MKIQKLKITQARGTAFTSYNKQPKIQVQGYNALKMTGKLEFKGLSDTPLAHRSIKFVKLTSSLS